MASVKDITESFRDAVRLAAAKLEYDASRMAKLTSSLIMRQPPPKSTFLTGAIAVLGNIRTMHSFIVMHRKDYLDRHRSTEQERDNIEHEVGLFVKACRERIDVLKDTIGVEQKKGQGSFWRDALKRGAQNADLIAHQHGVVLILSERLHVVTTIFDQLRAVRFQESIDRRLPKLRRGLQIQAQAVADNTYFRDWEVVQHDAPSNDSSQQALLDEETRTLQIELTSLMDSVQETEKKMLEMSALNHLFSTHVLRQAQQIELLYQQAVNATQNMVEGNKDLTKTIQTNSSSRTFILMFIFVLSFSLLFLDWYQ